MGQMLLLEPLPDEATPIATSDGEDGEVLDFGAYRAIPAARTLLKNGRRIDIGGRAFDLLVTLVRSRGKLVSKDEIFQSVWPTTTVDESNLRFQMTVLRKVLGRDRDLIKTIPGRGYLFAVAIHSTRPASIGLRSAKPGNLLDEAGETGKALLGFLRSLSQYPEVVDALDALLATARPSSGDVSAASLNRGTELTRFAI